MASASCDFVALGDSDWPAITVVALVSCGDMLFMSLLAALTGQFHRVLIVDLVKLNRFIFIVF